MDAVFEYIKEHWVELLVALLTAAIGWFLGNRKARRDWAKKEFFDRLNISLTSIAAGTLQIRTLSEKPCGEIFLNRVATERVIDAARKTTADDPLLPLPDDDYWYYLNSVLNEVSEQFAAGVIGREVGAAVNCDSFLIALTCEAAGEMKTRKVRAMVVKKSLLETLPEEQPKLEADSHITRWQTLKQLAAAWRNTPRQFLSVEICV